MSVRRLTTDQLVRLHKRINHDSGYHVLSTLEGIEIELLRRSDRGDRDATWSLDQIMGAIA